MQKQTEENFKVAQLTQWGFAPDKDYTLGRVDAKMQNIWLEAKRGGDDIYKMLAQIIFTTKIEVAISSDGVPPYLGCFNQTQGAIIHENDIFTVLKYPLNWMQKPSKIDDETVKIVKSLLATTEVYDLKTFGQKLGEIVRTKYIRSSEVTITNVVPIYHEWLEAVGKVIDCDDKKALEELKPDCFLADLMTDGNKTITDKLSLLRRTLDEEFYYIPRDRKALFHDIKITDKQSYNNFWNKYKRPPQEKWQEIILGRRDLLKSDENRKKEGAFFTPAVWSKISKEYLAKELGENWQDEYYIWDCCCGTGNLEVGLVNEERVFMSTLEQQEINIIKQNNFMADSTLFQFDFLNDEWKPKSENGKIPNKLWEIIKKEPQKLVIYINPPYKEASSASQASGTGEAIEGVADTETKKQMIAKGLGKAGNDLFAQFYFRIYTEIEGCKIGSFSTLKNCNGSNFASFRETFPYKFCRGFLCRANSFDNVTGQFPISFQVWNTVIKEEQAEFEFDVLTNEGESVEIKKVYNLKKGEFINDWFKTNNRSTEEVLCFIMREGNDFQHQNYVALQLKSKSHNKANLYKSNLIDGLIYLAVRWAVPATWLNDRDQLLHPKKTIKTVNEIQQEEVYDFAQDEFFIGNCVVFSLLHRQNGTAWQLFKNSEIGLHGADRDLTVWNLATKREFSDEARSLIEISRKVYTLYYKNFNNFNVGRNDIWQALKDNDDFKKLNKEFLECQKVLAGKIAEGMIEFGFLRI